MSHGKICALVVGLATIGCSDSNPGLQTSADEVRIVVGDPEERLQIEATPVPISRPEGALTLAGSGSDLSLTLVGTVAAPIVDGVATQATSVSLSGNYAIVTYSAIGPVQKGSVDIIDLTTPATPVLLSQAIYTTLDVTRATVDSGVIYVAVSGEGVGNPDTTAGLRTLGLNSGLLSVGSSSAALSSFVATDVMVGGGSVFAASGDAGHVFTLDGALTVTSSVSVADLRGLAYSSPSPRIVALSGGASAALIGYDASLVEQWRQTYSGLTTPGGKAGLVAAGGKVFASAGTGGLQVHDASNGDLLTQIPLPSAASLGVAASELTVNDVDLSGRYVVIAGGAGGVFVAESSVDLSASASNDAGALGLLGRIGLANFNSGNDVAIGTQHIIAASGAGGIRILLAANTGAFTDASAATGFNLLTNQTASSATMLVGDLDNDGDLDAVAGGDLGEVLLQDGGAFRSTGLGFQLYGQHGLADLDDDGDLDLVGQGLQVFQNSGTGLFVSNFTASIAGPAAREGMGLGDLDGDGHMDLLVPSDNGIWVGHGNGTPGFTVSNSISGLDAPTSYGAPFDNLATADINGDRQADFLVRYDGGRLFLSDGDGTFTRDEQGLTLPSGAGTESGLCFGDIDDDGDVDLFVPSRTTGVAGTLFERSGLSFSDITVASGLSIAAEQTTCTFGDYDSDGDLDLLVGTTSGMALYGNDGAGVFTAVTEGLPVTGDIQATRFADYDYDGDLDVLAIRRNATNLLYQNGLDTQTHLYVRPIGGGAGTSPASPAATRVDLFDERATSLLQRREVGQMEGLAGQAPLHAYFGGLNPDQRYWVQIHFQQAALNIQVVPRKVSTAFGMTTVNRMLTVREAPTRGGVTLIVGDPGALTAGDLAVQATLTSLGFTVALADVNTITAGAIPSGDMVVWAASAPAKTSSDPIYQIAQPVLALNRDVAEDLSLNGDVNTRSSGVDEFLRSERVVTVGITGSQTVVTGPTLIQRLDDLASGFVNVAHENGSPDRSFAGFLRECGVLTDGTEAPAPRVFFGFEASELTPVGQTLFERMIRWLNGEAV